MLDRTDMGVQGGGWDYRWATVDGGRGRGVRGWTGFRERERERDLGGGASVRRITEHKRHVIKTE